jgi:hypothetical protein
VRPVTFLSVIYISLGCCINQEKRTAGFTLEGEGEAGVSSRSVIVSCSLYRHLPCGVAERLVYLDEMRLMAL